jgi:hypothetical protein
MTMTNGITIPFSKSLIKDMDDYEWDGVQELVKEPASILVYAHENQAKALIAMGTILNANGMGLMRMHVYHTCQEDPVLLQNFGEGFASGECPMCNETFYEEDVEYDLELIVKYNIKIED